MPILKNETVRDYAAGGAAFIGATAIANKARKKTSEAVQGKGKKSFGGLTNLAFEVGGSAAILTGLAKFGPKRLRSGIPAFGSLITNSFGAARRQGRGF